MGVHESAGRATREQESASIDELLADLGFTFAVIVAAIHMYEGAVALRQASSGEGSLLIAMLTTGAALSVGGLLFVDERRLLPTPTLSRLGIGFATVLVLAYVDVTALGVFAPVIGVESPQVTEPTLVAGYIYLDLVVQGNYLALTSLLAEAGMIGVFGTLYLGHEA
jgi:hypothetical protein